MYFNLGYLPKGTHDIIIKEVTTLTAVERAFFINQINCPPMLMVIEKR
ncbi:MnmM family RNA methyltransferase [Clostridium sp. JNZ X4-2]